MKRYQRFQWIVRGAALFLLSLLAAMAYQVEVSLELVDGLYAARRSALPRLTGEVVASQSLSGERPLVEQTAHPASSPNRLSILIDRAETHAVRVQVHVLHPRAAGDPRSLIDARLAGNYGALRAWLSDICRSSPDLAIVALQFRKGPSDDGARGEANLVYGQ